MNLHFPPELKEILMQGDARPRSEKPQGEDWLSEPAFPRASLRKPAPAPCHQLQARASAVLGLGARRRRTCALAFALLELATLKGLGSPRREAGGAGSGRKAFLSLRGSA